MTRYKFAVLVVAVSSGAAAITSWQEFADTARKTERCATLTRLDPTARVASHGFNTIEPLFL